jgi:putative intracellular protease/amidase
MSAGTFTIALFIAASGATKLTPPEHGHMAVAFVLTEGAVMIDFAGPWEVFQDVMIPSRGSKMEDQHVFRPYVVSDTKDPIRVSGGMLVTPDYTFDDAPDPRIVVIPAQHGQSPKMLEWLKKQSKVADIVMSVCTGAFKLAKAGLLDGKKATTHHSAYVRLAHEFPRVEVERDVRWVESDPVVHTSGGLTAGIDLALHIVDAYFGREVAAMTARQLEYESDGWMGDARTRVKYSVPLEVHTPADRYAKGALGNWRGMVTTNEGTYLLAVHIWPGAEKRLVASFDSLDEDVFGLPIDVVESKGRDVHFEITGIHGVFDGKLDAKEQTIQGTWMQKGDSSRALSFTRAPSASRD